MTELAAWVLFPLISLVLLTGVGLLVERVARLELHPALVAPLGFCAAIAIVGPGYALEQGSELALVVVAVAAAAGLVAARRELWPRFRPGLGAAAGLAVYALYIAPVVFHGAATFLGYNFLNDTAIHLALVDYLDGWGRRPPSFLPDSTFKYSLAGYVAVDYPLGSHELMAALRDALPIDAARLYQPFLAISAGLAASGLFALLRDVKAPPPAAAGAAALAMSSQLLFSFNLQGGIKEVSFVTALVALAATGARVARGGAGAGGGLVLGMCALGGYATYGLASLAWLAPAAAIIGLALLVRRRWKDVVLALAATLAVFAVLGGPTVLGSIDYYRYGQDVLESEGELGPLAGPLKKTQASGMWLNADYRFPPQETTLNDLLTVFALVLAGAGLVLCLARGLVGPLLFLVPPAVAWLVVSGRSSPYIDAKLLCVLSPAVLLFAAIGVAALRSVRLKLLAVPAAVVLVAGAMVGNAMAYRIALPAPIDRLSELGEVADRTAGKGLVLLNEFEEYAKHFGRDARLAPPYEVWTPAPAQLREQGGLFGNAYTLDELTWEYVRQFRVIVLRRSPVEPRPPGAGYERVWRGRWYEIWERREELPVVNLVQFYGKATKVWSATRVPDCDQLEDLAAANPVIAAERRPSALFDIAGGRLPVGWLPDVHDRFGLVARGAGTVRASASTEAGRHTVWLRGRTFRDVEVLLDGRRVGTARGFNGANQWIEVGDVSVSAGAHTVEVRRPSGSLAPGDRQADSIGPVLLAPNDETRLVRAGRGEGQRLCGRNLDWLQQLRP